MVPLWFFLSVSLCLRGRLRLSGERLLKQPKYIRIRDELLQSIRSGKLKPGDRLPTREHLVVQHSVTRTTIDKALAGLRQMGMVEASRRGGTCVAQCPEPPRVAIVSRFSFPDDQGLSPTSEATTRGMFASIVLQGKDLGIRYLASRDVLSDLSVMQDYEVMVFVEPDPQSMGILKPWNARIVYINRYGPDINFVATNHCKAQQEMTLRLLDQGRPGAQVFFLEAHRAGFAGEERKEGFVKACEERKRFYRMVKMQSEFGENLSRLMALTFEPGKQAILVSPERHFTGAVLQMAYRKGMKLGQDLLYSDFDNFDALQTHGIQINTVVQDYAQMGRQVVASIQKLPQEPVRIYVPHTCRPD